MTSSVLFMSCLFVQLIFETSDRFTYTRQHRLQEKSMFNLYGFDMRFLSMGYIRKKLFNSGLLETLDSSLDDCTFTGVDCDESRFIRSNTWNNNNTSFTSAIYIEWLPTSIRAVHFDRLNVAEPSKFSTRLFPRDSISIAIDHCHIGGHIDLTCLPVHLEYLSIRENGYFGTVWLTNLPLNFRVLDLRDGFIDCVMVDNHALPKTFQRAQFLHEFPTEQIKTKAVHGGNVDPRVSVFSRE